MSEREQSAENGLPSATSHGPVFRWFAWRPVWTDDRGWRWLRPVWRRRFYLNLDGQPAMSWFVHTCVTPPAESCCGRTERHCRIGVGITGSRCCPRCEHTPTSPANGNDEGAA